MQSRDEIIRKNARKIVEECCNIGENDNVVIITDDQQSPFISQAIFTEVQNLNGTPVIITMEQSMPGAPLPEAVNDAISHADVIITPTTTSIYHAAGIHNACKGEGKARLLALSECSEDTLLEGGIKADFKAIKPIVEGVGKYFEKGKHICITTPAGTFIEADISDRPAHMNTGICHEPGDLMGLPTIEVFIAPNEKSVNGKIVVDASCSGGVGVIESEPIVITVVEGRATKFSGGKEAKKLEELLASAGTESVYQVAELAIGLNPDCRITGKIVEDEGKYGTCHMALGSNTSFGGINKAPLHIDMVQFSPTVLIDGEEICIGGELQVVDKEFNK